MYLSGTLQQHIRQVWSSHGETKQTWHASETLHVPVSLIKYLLYPQSAKWPWYCNHTWTCQWIDFAGYRMYQDSRHGFWLANCEFEYELKECSQFRSSTATYTCIVCAFSTWYMTSLRVCILESNWQYLCYWIIHPITLITCTCTAVAVFFSTQVYKRVLIYKLLHVHVQQHDKKLGKKGGGDCEGLPPHARVLASLLEVSCQFGTHKC